jgi:hypothetical protein
MKGLNFKQQLIKKMKLFKDDPNDKTLKPTFHIMKDSSKFGFFLF